MSSFSMQRKNVSKTSKIENFNKGNVLLHEYDFGSPTETLITVVGTVYRKQQKGVRLLARNVPITFACCECGAPAKFIALEDYDNENPYYCEKCIEKNEELCDLTLPITNSPRMGVCGYSGEMDKFAFVDDKCQS